LSALAGLRLLEALAMSTARSLGEPDNIGRGMDLAGIMS
jgi:hypothetical protein